MNTKTEIENLKNRLNKLREALKSGNSRFSTPTQSRSNAKSRDTSPTPKAKSKDNTPTREKKLSPLTREIMLSPLTKGSAWKNTPKSKSPSESISGESSSIFSKQSNPRRSTVNISASPDRKQMMRNNSQVQEMSDKIEKLRQTLFEEINSKIQTLGNLQSSVENLKYQLSNKKQEKKSEVDKNLCLNVYVFRNINNDTNYKSACEQNSREIDNMKLRMDSIRTETQEIYSQMVSDKDAIDMINPLINMLKNENTVLKVIYY